MSRYLSSREFCICFCDQKHDTIYPTLIKSHANHHLGLNIAHTTYTSDPTRINYLWWAA